MRRLLRWAFNGLAAVSLLLCVAACVLWVRSYWVGDAMSINLPQFGRPLADDTIHIVSGRGGLCVSLDRWASWELNVLKPTRSATHPDPVVHTILRPYYPYKLNATIFQGWGCEISSHREPISPTSVGSGIVYEVNVVMPQGVIALGAAVLPLFWWQRRVRGRPNRIGLCASCGYDLRATPDRCPECGKETDPKRIPISN